MDRRVGCAWGVVVAVATSIGGRAAPAEALTFPGPAPCDTTLAACVAGAAPGDVVELATDGPIDQSIVVDKSLTIEPAAGFTPTFAPTRGVNVSLSDAAKTVVLRGLTFSNGAIGLSTSGAASHSVTITDCAITQTSANNNSRGIDVLLRTPGTIVIERNEVVSNGNPIMFATTQGSGAISASISSNRVRKATVGLSALGIGLDLRGSFTITLDVHSNVISDVADCNCGNPGALRTSLSDTVSATVNLVNNTIDLAPEVGINVPSPAVGQLLVANVYNNVVTRTANALVLPAANPRLTVNNGYNDFFNNTVGPTFGGYLADPSNVAVDPLYVSLVMRDYHLQAGSPLRNAGTNGPPGGLSELDADGNVRLEGIAVDIGAYEFGSSPPTTTTTTVAGATTTTTTTLPGCAAGATTGSVLCRLDELAAALQARVPAGALAGKLGALVTRARTAVASAETATKPKARKRALAAAIRATSGFGKKLRSRKAKDLDADTRSTLGAAADAIKADLKTLKAQ